jgi:WD40 repeat protein
MDLSKDGSKLAGVTSEGDLYIWDVKNEYSPSVYKNVLNGNRITSIVFSPAGRDVILGTEKGLIKIVNVSTGVVRKTLSGSSQIEQIVFSNSGRFVAVLDKTNTIRIWNAQDLNHAPLVIRENVAICILTFSPDEKQLLFALKEKDYSIHVSPLRSDVMAKELNTLLKRNMTAEEWDQYVGDDVPYQATCSNLPRNDR